MNTNFSSAVEPLKLDKDKINCEKKLLFIAAKKDLFEKQQKKINKVVQEFFKDCTEPEKGIINKHFNDRFNAGDTSEPLTEKNLKSFLEKKRAQLARIFHTDSSRGAAQHDADKGDEDFGAELYWTYRSSLNRSPTQSASGSRKPQQNWDEISGLEPWPMFSLVLSLGIAHDMTAYWRQLRPTES